MEQYRMCELSFTGKKLEDHWAQIDLKGMFCCGDRKLTVTGFYAGDGVYKVRFLPDQAGTWSYRIFGCVEAEGTVEVAPAESVCQKETSRALFAGSSDQGETLPAPFTGRPRKSHGLVRAEGQHFVYQDGKPFYPFGTTVYALMHQEDSLVAKTMESLKGAPFNKVRFCVFPKHYDFNHNEPPVYAFEKKEDGSWDVNRPCFAFWDRLDEILCKLEEMEIQADLILFHPYDRWGFSRMPGEDNLIYLDYLLRRLAARPNVWWSLANEYDLCSAKSLKDWEEIECFVAEHDPYRHLLSNHNCFVFWDFSRPNVSHVSVQTKMLTRVSEWRQKYQKPVVVDECCYEGNIRHFWGSISGKEMINRFWRVVTMGGYCTHGETFLNPEKEILWWSRGGVLKGESPARIAFLRSIVEELPGPIEPAEVWATKVLHASPEEKERLLVHGDHFVKAMLRMGDELKDFCASEFTYQGHCKEDAYLTFYDLRTCTEDVLELPEDKVYRVELIDTWEMTRTVLLERASKKTQLALPGKEGMAVLAVRIE